MSTYEFFELVVGLGGAQRAYYIKGQIEDYERLMDLEARTDQAILEQRKLAPPTTPAPLPAAIPAPEPTPEPTPEPEDEDEEPS